MKIFITGVAGFLGSHVADAMIRRGYNVIGNDNFICGDPKNLNDKISFFNVDCLDLEEMTCIMQGCDIVFHAACAPHESMSFFSPNIITQNVFQATVSTLTAAIRNQIKRFVYCSSIARYGNIKPPFREIQIPKPVDPYGVSKLASEGIVRALCDTYGIEWNIAVPHNIIGPRQKYDDPYRNVVSIMIHKNLKGEPSIIFGDGHQKRCFTYISDCVDSLEKMILDHNIASEIINIGPDSEVITINELARIIKEETNCNADPVYHSSRMHEVKHAVCSSIKARNLLNFQEKVPLRSAIKKCIEYIKENGIRDFKYYIDFEINSNHVPEVWRNKKI